MKHYSNPIQLPYTKRITPFVTSPSRGPGLVDDIYPSLLFFHQSITVLLILGPFPRLGTPPCNGRST